MFVKHVLQSSTYFYFAPRMPLCLSTPHGFTDNELLALSWICTTQNKRLYMVKVNNSYKIFFCERVLVLKIAFLSYFHYNIWS